MQIISRRALASVSARFPCRWSNHLNLITRRFPNKLLLPVIFLAAFAYLLLSITGREAGVFSELDLHQQQGKPHGSDENVGGAAFDLESECQNPFSSELLKSVESNCSNYRFITIPDDQGRLGHGMSQVHILLVFQRMLERRKRETGRGTHVTHVAVVPRQKEMLMCEMFARPKNVYFSLPLVQDACNLSDPWGSWAATSLQSWETDFPKIADRDIHLGTWPMPRMYLRENVDIRRNVFRIQPGWTRRADQVLQKIRETHTGRPSEFIFVHIRRTDYLRLVTEFWNVSAFKGNDIDRVISKTAARRPNATFLVLGDDDNWCRSNIQFGPRVLMMPTMRRPELAFAIMARCNGGIFTYGSFGQWAGIVGGGNLTRLVPRVAKERLPDFLQNTDEDADAPDVEVVYHP